jgi:hypothetical protein
MYNNSKILKNVDMYVPIFVFIFSCLGIIYVIAFFT